MNLITYVVYRWDGIVYRSFGNKLAATLIAKAIKGSVTEVHRDPKRENGQPSKVVKLVSTN